MAEYARPEEMAEGLRRSVVDFVVEYMSLNDSSHDAEHILRVSRSARRIFLSEIREGRLRESQASRTDDGPVEAVSWPVVYYSALLHDLFDAKYAARGPLLGYTSLATYLVEKLGFDSKLAAEVNHVCDHVSFSKQKKNPELVGQALKESPALRIVQDADRLDAIGAVGIARTFCFTGAMDGKDMVKGGTVAGRGFGETIQHFHDKLLHLQDMMNTETGKALAKERTHRMAVFLEWWEDEYEDAGRGPAVAQGLGRSDVTFMPSPSAHILDKDSVRTKLLAFWDLR